MTPLFVIPLWADLLAVGIGAAQGALFAAQFRDRRLDLLGVAIIGIATGFGGGILRDVLLSEVPAALSSNWYLIVATGAALLGMLLERLISRMGPLVNALDALTIGLFGAIGTTKALAMGLPVVPAIFV
ncbi:MAG TPA: TRIC cation channel family protein, partial [Rhodoglobus sp.]|nr:TRIC cation channel family protein [Rhodoglobus sp.]